MAPPLNANAFKGGAFFASPIGGGELPSLYPTEIALNCSKRDNVTGTTVSGGISRIVWPSTKNCTIIVNSIAS